MWRQVDIIWQPALTSSVVGPRRSSKALSKAKLAPKKGHGHCLVVCCPNDLLQLSESWQNHNMRSMLNKLMRCTENCNTCSHLWSTERAQFFSMAMPDHKTHNQHFKSWIYWAMKFCLICHIHPTSRQPSWQLFAGEMLPQPAGGRKCFPRVGWILKHGFLCYRNKETYFSLAKMCWL